MPPRDSELHGLNYASPGITRRWHHSIWSFRALLVLVSLIQFGWNLPFLGAIAFRHLDPIGTTSDIDRRTAVIVAIFAIAPSLVIALIGINLCAADYWRTRHFGGAAGLLVVAMVAAMVTLAFDLTIFFATR